VAVAGRIKLSDVKLSAVPLICLLQAYVRLVKTAAVRKIGIRLVELATVQIDTMLPLI
jgi:hypothetical protein